MSVALPVLNLSAKTAEKSHASLLPNKSNYCPSCGGVYAYFSETYQHPDLGSICNTCIRRFKSLQPYNKKFEDLTPNDFNQFLADNLAKSLARLKKHGVVGRCEALTVIGVNPLARGYQCGQPAVHKKNGYIVCGVHKRNAKNGYVDNPCDPYIYLEDMMEFVARKDRRFMEIIKRISQRH